MPQFHKLSIETQGQKPERAENERPNPGGHDLKTGRSGAFEIAENLADYLEPRLRNGAPWTVFDRNLVQKVLEDLAAFVQKNDVKRLFSSPEISETGLLKASLENPGIPCEIRN